MPDRTRQPVSTPAPDADSEIGPVRDDFGSNAANQDEMNAGGTGQGTTTPVLQAAGATGGTPPGGPTPRAVLTQLWTDANKEYLEGLYALALPKYERLLREDPKTNYHDEYTWNAAQSATQLGQKSKALGFFRTYLTMNVSNKANLPIAQQYIAALSGTASSSNMADQSKQADAVKILTDTVKKLKSGASQLGKAAAKGAGSSQVPSWFSTLASSAQAIAGPCIAALDGAKKNLSPEIYLLDQLLGNLTSFGLNYDSMGMYAEWALDPSSGAKIQRDSLELFKGLADLLPLYVPAGLSTLGAPLGPFFTTYRPTVLKLSSDARSYALPGATQPSAPSTTPTPSGTPGAPTPPSSGATNP